MTAGSPALERSVRGRVLAELRASPSLWREYRAQRKARRRNLRVPWLLRLLLPIGLFGMSVTGRDHDLGWVVILSLALYATGSAFLRAGLLLHGLWGSTDLMVLSHLPVPEEDFFRFQWRKFVRASGWMLYAFVTYYSMMALKLVGTVEAAGGAALLGVLQWITLLGIASALAAWRPRWKLLGVGNAFCIAAVVLWIFRTTLAQVDVAPGSFFVALPAGWVSIAFREGILNGSARSLGWAGPSVLGLLLVAAARRRLRQTYGVREIVFARPAAEMLLEREVQSELRQRRLEDPGIARTPAEAQAVRADLLRSLPEVNEQKIRDGAFLAAPDVGRGGPLERLCARFLTPRERVVSELILGRPMAMSRRWRFALIVTAIGALMASAPSLPLWFLLVPPGIFLFTLFDGGWWGFRIIPCAGKFLPMHAAYPVEYREVSGVFFKLAAVRILAWLPLMLAMGTIGGWRFPHLTAVDGFVFALKAAWTVLALQPVIVAARFSSGTNDTERLTFRGCFGLVIPAMLLGIPGLVAAVCQFAVPGPYALFGAAGMILFSAAFWAFYGRVYRSVDLVRSTPPGANG